MDEVTGGMEEQGVQKNRLKEMNEAKNDGNEVKEAVQSKHKDEWLAQRFTGFRTR